MTNVQNLIYCFNDKIHRFKNLRSQTVQEQLHNERIKLSKSLSEVAYNLYHPYFYYNTHDDNTIKFVYNTT